MSSIITKICVIFSPLYRKRSIPPGGLIRCSVLFLQSVRWIYTLIWNNGCGIIISTPHSTSSKQISILPPSNVSALNMNRRGSWQGKYRLRLNISMNILDHFSRSEREIGGIVHKRIGASNISVENVTKNRKWEHIVCVIPQNNCEIHSMMST